MAKTVKVSPNKSVGQVLIKSEEMPFDIPSNWIWVKLIGGFAECLDNFREPINANERAQRVGDIPYYGATGQVGWIDDYLTDENLVLLGEDGAPFYDFIKDKAYMIEGKAWVNNHAHILKSYYGIIGNKYLMHYLNCFDYHGYVHGTTRLKLTQGRMRDIPVPLPPMVEQRRIVDLIELYFQKLDDASELVQNVVDTFENRKTSILHKAFTGELTSNWRKHNVRHSNTLLIDIYRFYKGIGSSKDIINISESQKTVTVNDEINNSIWYKCTLGAIGTVCNGSTPSRKESSFWDGDIPWISSGEVKNNIIHNANEFITKDGYENSSVRMLKKGTVLIAMIGEGKTRGQTSILEIEATINQNIAAIDLSHNYVESKFVWYWLQYQYRKNRSEGNGSGPKALNCQRVRELEFILPPLDEQREIVKIIDSIYEKESKARELCEVIENIENMKKTILARAFRGELNTNNPDEESAQELLKEILMNR